MLTDRRYYRSMDKQTEGGKGSSIKMLRQKIPPFPDIRYKMVVVVEAETGCSAYFVTVTRRSSSDYKVPHRYHILNFLLLPRF